MKIKVRGIFVISPLLALKRFWAKTIFIEESSCLAEIEVNMRLRVG